MDRVALDYLIGKLRASPKPRFVRAKQSRLDNFHRSCVGWTGNVGLSKKRESVSEPFDVVLVEITPDLQQLLTYIYAGARNEPNTTTRE